MQPTILILDDDPSIQKTMTHSLSSHHYAVTCASTANEALVCLQHNTFDLVLVDYALTEHDGLWFLRHARIPQDTKIILITGYASRELIMNMFSLGISGYLIKPIDEEMLLHNIQYYLKPTVTCESDDTADAPEHG